VPPTNVAPWEAVAAGRRGGHDNLLGWGGERRRCRGEEVADVAR